MVLSSRLTTTLLLPVKVCQRGRCLNRCCWHSRLILGIVRVSDAGGFFSSQPYSHRGKGKASFLFVLLCIYLLFFIFFCVCEESIVKVTDYNLKTKRVLVSQNY